MSLVDAVPGFAQVRNVFRSAVFVHVAVALLASLGLQAAKAGIGMFLCGRWARYAALVVLVAAGIIAVAEINPPAQSLYPVPSHGGGQAWIKWLKMRTSEDAIVVCVPFPFMPDVGSYEREALWLYWGTFHHRRMLNGYSSYFPKTFIDLKMPMAEFPTPETIDLLYKIGVDFCVVGRNSIYGQDTWRYSLFDGRVERVFEDKHDLVDVYRLK
jgi:hypothetical protein